MSPIHTLPIELLAEIFELAIHDDTHINDVFRISQVCFDWRQLTRGTPRLWARPIQINVPKDRKPRKVDADSVSIMTADLDPAAAQPGLVSPPWYLLPTYDPTEIVIDSDGSVRAGTVPALVEHFTAQEQADETFIKVFFVAFRSFTTIEKLFTLLVQRFSIQPPPKMTQVEYEDWSKFKHDIQSSVLNLFKSLIESSDVLEKDDVLILHRIAEFLLVEEVARFPAAKQLLILIERAVGPLGKVLTGSQLQRGSDVERGVSSPPLLSQSSQQLKLSDIEPLELARQLTIIESQLYQKIRPVECLRRVQNQQPPQLEHNDNISIVIQTSNKIAFWVAESVLSHENSQLRAGAVEHLISVADHCRRLNNFSTMVAITAGLNTRSIRRLKRTWEQVDQKYAALFSVCEMIIDSDKGFTTYRSMMAPITPPCVPFLGTYLPTLQFIRERDGRSNNMPALVDLRKLQETLKVAEEMERFQAPFDFHVIPAIQAYIEESLSSAADTKELSECLWTLSLEREPRERDDSNMARLLQESGFL
ncbi:ras guanine nucleotide exchange factor domain-containing protein [Mycena galopus ATCC 62051]|nr:ras guanine nucleotide exchange factor domain-containing protein [Mycena galopus ATCC 62051]